MAEKLTWEEEIAFDDLIKKTVACRYADEIERLECPKECTPSYCPTNEVHVRELLVGLWGERITMDEIDRVCEDLVTYGLETPEEWTAWWEEEEATRRQELEDYEASQEQDEQSNAGLVL